MFAVLGAGSNCQLSSQFANISLMVPDADTSSVQSTSVGLGAALRRAWLGYQLRLDRAMADAGFGERGFPDGRVLRVCSNEAGSTISAIGRELGITRQGASKVVTHLFDLGYVVVADSTTSKREKSVVLTPRGVDYLAHRASGPGDRGRIAGRTRGRGALRTGRVARLAGRWGGSAPATRTFVARRASSPSRKCLLVIERPIGALNLAAVWSPSRPSWLGGPERPRSAGQEDQTDQDRGLAVLVEEHLGGGVPTRAMTAEMMKVKVKTAAEAPLNLRALFQIANPPRTGAMLPRGSCPRRWRRFVERGETT